MSEKQGNRFTDGEQTDLLASLLPGFLNARLTGDVAAYVTSATNKYLAKYPAKSSEEEAAIRKKLQNWFPNNARATSSLSNPGNKGTKARKSKADTLLPILSKKKPQHWQGYQTLYYKGEVQKAHELAWSNYEKQPREPNEKVMSAFAFKNDWLRKRFATESDEVKKAVADYIAHGTKPNEDDNDAKERRRLECIGKLAKSVEAFGKGVYETTGFAITLMVGGRHPSYTNENHVLIRHYGATPDGLFFNDWLDDDYTKLTGLFSDFLEDVFGDLEAMPKQEESTSSFKQAESSSSSQTVPKQDQLSTLSSQSDPKQDGPLPSSSSSSSKSETVRIPEKKPDAEIKPSHEDHPKPAKAVKPQISEYEVERRARIAQNALLMKLCGLEGGFGAMLKGDQDTQLEETSETRKALLEALQSGDPEFNLSDFIKQSLDKKESLSSNPTDLSTNPLGPHASTSTPAKVVESPPKTPDVVASAHTINTAEFKPVQEAFEPPPKTDNAELKPVEEAIQPPPKTDVTPCVPTIKAGEVDTIDPSKPSQVPTPVPDNVQPTILASEQIMDVEPEVNPQTKAHPSTEDLKGGESEDTAKGDNPGIDTSAIFDPELTPDAPEWLVPLWSYLVGISTHTAWRKLLRSWLQFENRGPAQGYLPAGTKRPDEITSWIKKHRKPETPSLDPIKFMSQVVLWWTSMQPAWRVGEQPSTNVVDFVREDRVETWSVLRKGGKSGFGIVVISLGWCIANYRDGEVPQGLVHLIEDALWVVDRMVQSLPSGSTALKRAHDTADSRRSKRHRG